MQQFWFPEGHGLDHGVVFTALAFHHVGSQGPWCANEAKHCCLVADAFSQSLKHRSNEWHRFSGIQRSKRIDLFHGSDWIANLRPLALDDVEINPHARQGREDVRKQDHPIRFEGTEGLHRDLIGEVWIFRTFTKTGIFVSKVPVDLHVPACLAHHPHGRTLHRFATCGTQQQGEGVAHQAGSGQPETYPSRWISSAVSP